MRKYVIYLKLKTLQNVIDDNVYRGTVMTKRRRLNMDKKSDMAIAFSYVLFKEFARFIEEDYILPEMCKQLVKQDK